MGIAGELREAPDAVRAQAGLLAEPVAELVARLHFRPPAVVVTCAPGSSAHVGTRYPVLALMPTDAALQAMRALVRDLAGKGAALFATAPDGALPVLAPDHPESDAVCLIQAFYAMMLLLTARLDIDPDRPRHLQKVTRTR